MSTKFTSRGIALVDSQSLQLIQSASRLNDVMTKYIYQRLVEKGYGSLTPSLLSFLSILECGVNYGSEIARNLDVTRQMVAKTVKELCQLGFLEQKQGAGKQKEILFTEMGEKLMSDARQLLAELDDMLFNNAELSSSRIMISELNKLTCAVNERQQ
ncbi:MarR family transcriptional regulator [Paraglaciecola sp.]|uniref:MarR family transcriptional regulator n=1 Tax=Paraglaciecola sp. TaxID=1920173 RepID=UPI00326720B4